MTKYYAARPMSIQSHELKPGDEVGSGDVSKGEFTPAKGLEKAVAVGHVIPRLADGRIVTQWPPPSKDAGEKKPTKAAGEKKPAGNQAGGK